MFVISGFCYMATLYYNWAEEYCLLHQGLCYIHVGVQNIGMIINDLMMMMMVMTMMMMMTMMTMTLTMTMMMTMMMTMTMMMRYT